MKKLENQSKESLDLTGLAAEIKRWGKELGFQEIAITDTDLSTSEPYLEKWLAQGFHGEMDYMAKHGVKRSRPAELVPGTLRIISARLNYKSPLARDSWQIINDKNKAFISRYALGKDYHAVLRAKLRQLAEKIESQTTHHEYRVFTDSAPVMEVALAVKAGLGWRGKHTLLLTRDHGSLFFLGEIYTNLPLPVDNPQTDHCGSCTACIDVCPTQAIVAPYELDARRCISYLTIELKGSIPIELRSLIGNRVYGCDDCQLVCPWNKFAQTSTEQDFAVKHGLDDVDLITLFNWSEEQFNSNLKDSAIHRIGYERWLRNLAVGLGNAPTSDAVIATLTVRKNDHSLLVREHVEWALKQHMPLI